MDALFARPTKPASAPRVRAFAELAMNEIRSGMGGEASLLADKHSFSEFMDRVNESVLLGRREPPSAASVLRDTQECSQQGEQDSANPRHPDNDISTASPVSSLQSFVVNRSSNVGPSTVSTTSLEALSSQLAFSPGRRHRQRNNGADSEHALQRQQPSQSSATSHRVRFDVCEEDEGLGPSVGLPEPLQHREHGSVFAREEGGHGREQDQDMGNEASMSSEDLAGTSLLQELRRWRSTATAEIHTEGNHNHPHLPPPPAPSGPSTSGRTSSVASWGSPPPPQLSQFRGMPLPSPRGVHRGSNGVVGTRGSELVGKTKTSAEPEESRARREGGWLGGGDGEHNTATVMPGGACREASSQAEEPNGEPEARGTARQLAQGRTPRSLHPSDPQRERVENSVVDGAGVMTSAALRWRGFDSDGQGKSVAKREREEFAEAETPAQEKGREGDDATELSLDLSDCSDEKLGAVLQRGRAGRGE